MKIIRRYLPLATATFATGFAIGVLIFVWAYNSI